MRKLFFYFNILILGVILLSACTSKETIQHIEVYVIETMEQYDEGLFEPSGFKKVNAITTSLGDENQSKTEVKTIEDFYDIVGNYVKTTISHLKFDSYNLTKAVDSQDREKEIQKPSTILIPDDHSVDYQLDDMSEEEIKKVKEHVESVINQL